MLVGFIAIYDWGIYINKKIAEKIEYKPRVNVKVENFKIVIEFAEYGEYSACYRKGGIYIPCRSKVKNIKKGKIYEVFVRDNKVIAYICQL